MLIKCGPRFVRIITVRHDPTDRGPRDGSKWLNKIGTIVTWGRHPKSIGRTLCDSRTDAARVDMAGSANWLVPWPHMHYQQWHDQLPYKHICAILPIYIYEWSAVVRVATEPLDGSEHVTGQCGWIYCTNKSVNRKWPSLRYKPHERNQKATEIMAAEIQELDLWLRDGSYMWRVEDVENRPGVRSGEVAAAMGGFYGSNPVTNGMMATIPKQYRHLLEAWCNERGLS